MLNGFTLAETICQKILEKQPPKNARSPLKVLKVELHRLKIDMYMFIYPITVHCGPSLGFTPATNLNIAHAVNGEML